MPRLSKIGAAALGAFGWTGLASVSASYLVVAGGGGGGYTYGGGGGAGGYRTGTASLNPTLSYTVTIGAGGTGSTSSSLTGNQGSDSVFNAITSTGGGGGGSANDVLNSSTSLGANGGSGGGGAANASGGTVTRAGGSGNTPSTSPSQGNNGGSGVTDSATYRAGGGGGGSSAVGVNGTSSATGSGGNGTANSISGTSVTYAGGGGGGAFGTTQGAGGTGGGGAGGVSTSTAPVAGTANLGGGGGAAGNGPTYPGASGGSGVVIISYLGAQQFGGGVVTSSGGYTIHTFNTSGTLAPLSSLTASYLIVAGGGGAGGQETTAGGGGWSGGGGGAGGMLTGSGTTIDTNSTYLVTVGSGGAGGTSSASPTDGTSGSSSSFSMITTTAVGGGGGGKGGGNVSGAAGLSGGSGGGGGSGFTGAGAAGGAGTSGQGSAGGTCPANSTGGGGGGKGGAGGVPTRGAGSTSSISGASVTYAAGGLGQFGTSNTAGTANTGNGGDNGTTINSNSLAGGSGVVIISYAGATQQMAGGTVTISGGSVIHTFTSSGYLTPLKLVNNSLRFRSSASAYLNRTPTTAGSGTTFTWSGWIKRGILGGSNYMVMYSAGSGDTAVGALYFGTDDKLNFLNYNGAVNWQLISTAVYRDPAAWYHIVAVVDTTQSTSSNRIKLYVNGSQVTAFDTATYPSASYASPFFNQTGYVQFISRWGTWNASHIFDGYMTEVNFIDGQALTPNSFGTFNSYGVWQPITYGGSYGTNGFYLPFTNTTSTTTLGYDFSPQSNNWTTNNISLTTGSTYDSMTDVPTLTSATASNYAVWNPLDKATVTVTDGNLAAVSGADVHAIRASMGLPLSGKFYWEITVSGLGYGSSLGIANAASNLTTGSASAATRTYQWGSWFNSFNSGVVQYGTNQAVTGGTNWSGASQLAASDVLMIAVDMDNGSMWVGKNNAWFNSSGTANPATNTDPRWTGLGGTTWFAYYSSYGSTSPPTVNINFGQQGFKYTPPTGFVALNTYNI